jgi:hypothetical protein
MRKSKSLTSLCLASFFTITDVIAGASGHAGHSAGGGGGGSDCLKPHLSNFLPAHLATVAPGSEFSFMAVGVQHPEQISVTVKSIPVAITVEDKEAFYRVKGKLPPELSKTAARINIKVTSKYARCDAENGWLLKISDK